MPYFLDHRSELSARAPSVGDDSAHHASPQHLLLREKKESLGKLVQSRVRGLRGPHAKNNTIGLFYLVAVVCSTCPHMRIRPSRIQTPGVSWHSFTFCTIIKIIVKTVAMLTIMLIRPYHTSYTPTQSLWRSASPSRRFHPSRRVHVSLETRTNLHSSGDRGGSEEPIAQHPVRTAAVRW